MTAGKLVIEGGSFHLNKLVLDQAEIRNTELNNNIAQSKQQEELKHLIDCCKTNETFEQNKTCNVNNWKTAHDICDFLRPLRQ